jgi:hypothetical protein
VQEIAYLVVNSYTVLGASTSVRRMRSVLAVIVSLLDSLGVIDIARVYYKVSITSLFSNCTIFRRASGEQRSYDVEISHEHMPYHRHGPVGHS